LEPIAGATFTVNQNVALLQLNGLTAQNLELRPGALRRFFSQGSGPLCHMTFAIYRLPADAHMDWLAPNGRVVKHTLIQFPLYVGMRHPAPASTVRGPNCGSSG
jgi:hypothetical protein